MRAAVRDRVASAPGGGGGARRARQGRAAVRPRPGRPVPRPRGLATGHRGRPPGGGGPVDRAGPRLLAAGVAARRGVPRTGGVVRPHVPRLPRRRTRRRPRLVRRRCGLRDRRARAGGSRGRVRDWGDAEAATRWRSADDEDERLRLEAADGAALWHLLPPAAALAVVDAYVELDASVGARAVAAAGRRAESERRRAESERRRADAAMAALAEADGRLRTALAERDEAQRTAAAERVRATATAAEAERWRSRADSLRRSPSMRVGRTLTAPARAWRDRRDRGAGRPDPERGQ